MGVNVFGSRNRRKIERLTGLSVANAYCWSNGRWVYFVTEDHVHGLWDRRTNEWYADNALAKQDLGSWGLCGTFCEAHFEKVFR